MGGVIKRKKQQNYQLAGLVAFVCCFVLFTSSSSNNSTDYNVVDANGRTTTAQDSGLRSTAGGESGSRRLAEPNYVMASKDSGGFFTDITNEHWMLLKKRVKERQNYMKPNSPNRNIDFPRGWYQENFEPDFTCLHERRIGGMGDGPKWICDPHRLSTKKDCLVYSVGSSGDFSFETAVMSEIGRNCEIHTFDPELKGKNFGKRAPEGVNYHAWGIMPEDASVRASHATADKFKTLKDTLKTLNHEGREIDLFKIDCEGCEWNTVHDWFSAGVTLRQILVETHETPRDKVHTFFLGLQKAGYVTFHKEPNIQFAEGNCIEYAFFKLEASFFEGMNFS